MKSFAMGVRAEHPQELIDRIQYHGNARGEFLPAASYNLVKQIDGRGVYSFCRARPSTWPTRAFAWAALVAVLAGGGWVGGRLVDVLTSKSQILKCRYTPHWDTLTVDKPSLGALLGGEVATRLAFDLEVHNPNRLPVRIEDNRVEIADGDGLVLARGRLTPFEAPAGATVRFRLGLEARLDAKSVLAGASLNPARWRVTLFLELDEGFEFPIFLAGGG